MNKGEKSEEKTGVDLHNSTERKGKKWMHL